jgi:hypothetical protein
MDKAISTLMAASAIIGVIAAAIAGTYTAAYASCSGNPHDVVRTTPGTGNPHDLENGNPHDLRSDRSHPFHGDVCPGSR